MHSKITSLEIWRKSACYIQIITVLYFSSRANSIIWMHYMDADLAYREKAWQERHKNATSYTEQILEVISNETAAVRPPTFHL